MVRIIFLFLFISIIASCNKERLEEYTGVIKDYTGLDGCGLLIDLDNGDRLMPVANISGVGLEENRRIAVKFRDKPVFNICMAGTTVVIVNLRYL